MKMREIWKPDCHRIWMQDTWETIPVIRICQKEDDHWVDYIFDARTEELLWSKEQPKENKWPV